jgi:hypothetical protein
MTGEQHSEMDEREIAQRRRVAARHAILLGLVSLGFLAMFILRTISAGS